ncbi:MAG: hypothetical protein QG604_400 [Candidatus Dependentiae bacterium]|nr:hypothetical protein [Candidatus Dependentiae bacterium]
MMKIVVLFVSVLCVSGPLVHAGVMLDVARSSITRAVVGVSAVGGVVAGVVAYKRMKKAETQYLTDLADHKRRAAYLKAQERFYGTCKFVAANGLLWLLLKILVKAAPDSQALTNGQSDCKEPDKPVGVSVVGPGKKHLPPSEQLIADLSEQLYDGDKFLGVIANTCDADLKKVVNKKLSSGGPSLFARAIELHAKPEVLDRLMNLGADYSGTGPGSALDYAARSGNNDAFKQIVRRMKKDGADLPIEPLLSDLARQGNAELFDFLADESGTTPTPEQLQSLTFGDVLRTGDQGQFKDLVDKTPADELKDVGNRDDLLNRAIDIKADPSVIQKLLDSGVDCPTTGKDPAFRHAYNAGNIEAFKQIIRAMKEQGADISTLAAYDGGQPLLFSVVQSNNQDLFDFLTKECGVSVNVRDELGQSILWATLNSRDYRTGTIDPDQVSRVLNLPGMNIGEVNPQDGTTLLFVQTPFGHETTMAFSALMERGKVFFGADTEGFNRWVNHTNKIGLTALDIEAMSECPSDDHVRLLVENGAEISAETLRRAKDRFNEIQRVGYPGHHYMEATYIASARRALAYLEDEFAKLRA